jgi:preprotein translocase subunit YajC
MNKNQKQIKVGANVVAKLANGDSVSAVVSGVFGDIINVDYYPKYAQKHTVGVPRANVTPFGAASFLTLE